MLSELSELVRTEPTQEVWGQNVGDSEVGSLPESESEPDHRVKVTTFSQKRGGGGERARQMQTLVIIYPPLFLGGSFPGGASGKNLPTNAGDVRDAGSVPGSGRSPGGRHGNPLHVG